MSPIRGTARFTGVLYLLMGLPAPINLIYFPGHFIVRGNAAATAQNIAADMFIYRIAVLCGLVSTLFFVVLVLSLYSLLKDVDRKQARLMVAFVLVAVAIGMVNLLNQIAPLVLLGGAEFASAFTKPQVDTLALAFLRLNAGGNLIASSLWGLWLLPFGILVIKSEFIPKIIGYLLILGCFAYLANSVTYILWPHYLGVVNSIALPLAGPGELSILAWLLIKGGKVPLPAA
jgi:hypothetical protein